MLLVSVNITVFSLVYVKKLFGFYYCDFWFWMSRERYKNVNFDKEKRGPNV